MLLYRSRFSRIKTILYTCIAMGPIILLNMTGLILFGAGIMGKVFILTNNTQNIYQDVFGK